MTATQGFKYRGGNVHAELSTKQHKRGRLDIVSFCASGLNRCRLTSRGSVLDSHESNL